MLSTMCVSSILLMAGCSAQRADVNIEFVNNCNFDVSFAWYATKCSGAKPNMLYLNEMVPAGKQTTRVASNAPGAGGRIYAWAAKDASPGEGMSQETFEKFMSITDDEVSCGSDYARYRLAAPPFQQWGAFAELSFSRNGNSILNDADVSMVDQFYLPMSWDWLYSDTSGLNPQCYNTSLTILPTQADCAANGGQWNVVPNTPYPGAPTGFCKSPSSLCQYSTSFPICSDQASSFQPLIDQLTYIYEDLQADKAFQWSSTNRTVFPGQVWICQGFFNSPKFEMADMCAGINRGLCDFSGLGRLSAEDFSSWIYKSCGTQINQGPASTWFKEGLVSNPYAKWLRKTLHGTTYAFSQDEGLHGGNSNCNNFNGGPVPQASRLTVCPKSSIVDIVV